MLDGPCSKYLCHNDLSENLFSVLERLEKNANVKMVMNRTNKPSYLCFCFPQQITVFHMFPEVICIDGTHATNRDGLGCHCLIRVRYTLYQFVVTDGVGASRVVFYAYLRHENNETLHAVLSYFKEVMGADHCNQTKAFAMDKMPARINAVRKVFGCEIVLCYFHIKQAIRRQVSSFTIYCSLLLIMRSIFFIAWHEEILERS